jgi:isoleucyl-tRNA synthetase
VTVAQLLAPFTPFVAEAIWRNLAAGRDGRPDSVHLSDYPQSDETLIDEELDAAVDLARRVVELGRRVRVETRTRTRQPLAEAVVHVPGDRSALEPLLGEVSDELNVKRVVFAESAEAFGRWRAKPNYRVLGPRLGPAVTELAAALASDDGSLAAELAHGGSVTVAGVPLAPADVDLTQEVLEGWGVASEGGVTVALELEITTELRREGTARELVRLVQDARRAAGLAVSDRIALGVKASGPAADAIAEALEAHGGYIAGETLAVDVRLGELEGDAFVQEGEIEGGTVAIALRLA